MTINHCTLVEPLGKMLTLNQQAHERREPDEQCHYHA